MEIDPKDLKVDTFRRGGAGAWLNHPDTAVRITHIPTGIYADCDDDRSQHRNKVEAMARLKDKLKEHYMNPQEHITKMTNHVNFYRRECSMELLEQSTTGVLPSGYVRKAAKDLCEAIDGVDYGTAMAMVINEVHHAAMRAVADLEHHPVGRDSDYAVHIKYPNEEGWISDRGTNKIPLLMSKEQAESFLRLNGGVAVYTVHKIEYRAYIVPETTK